MIKDGIQVCDKEGCGLPVKLDQCRRPRFCIVHQREWDNSYDNYVDPLHLHRNKDRIKTHD